MKKLIVLSLMTLMLVGCNGSTFPEPPTGKTYLGTVQSVEDLSEYSAWNGWQYKSIIHTDQSQVIIRSVVTVTTVGDSVFMFKDANQKDYPYYWVELSGIVYRMY